MVFAVFGWAKELRLQKLMLWRLTDEISLSDASVVDGGSRQVDGNRQLN